jgi:hypothetical protein
MSDTRAPAPSLVGITIRRSLNAGRIYIGIGIAVSVVLAFIFARSGKGAFESTFPLELPIFAVTGSMGSLLVFTSDRTKGVFEYLIAYGLRPLRLFATALVATAAMAALVLGVALGAGILIFTGKGGALSPQLLDTLGVYTIPMTFATALFVATVGMMWSALSTPRTGMNSPLGLAPMMGIIPTIAVLAAASVSPPSDYYYVIGGATALITGLVLVMVALSGRLLRRERLLSPM